MAGRASCSVEMISVCPRSSLGAPATHESSGALRGRRENGRSVGICASGPCGGDAGAVFCETRLELAGSLHLDLLLRRLSVARYRVAGRDAPVLLGLVEVLDDAVAVLLEDLVRDALHAKDLNVEALSVRQRVFDLIKRLFVDLVQMHGETWQRREQSARSRHAEWLGEMRTSRGVQSAAASVAFEVFGLLMRDEELQIFKVALAWESVSLVSLGEGGRRATDSSSTTAATECPRHRGDRASSCPFRSLGSDEGKGGQLWCRRDGGRRSNGDCLLVVRTSSLASTRKAPGGRAQLRRLQRGPACARPVTG